MTRAESVQTPTQPPASSSVCRICGNRASNRTHIAQEMMLGLRDEFSYLECGDCGCVQIQEIPADMPKYYPADYYSFDQHGPVTTFLRHCRARHALERFNLIGWLLSELVVPHDAMLAIRRVGPATNAAILDVGCGSGRLLLDLAWLGYKNLTGVDPFVAKDIVHPSGPKVFKKHIEAMQGEFDLVMLHHSFEHMDQPQAVMQAVTRLLKPGGHAIVRIPVASSFAWREYGVNWVNMDPPRHFFLHTFASIRLLADQAGLELQETRHEGNPELFWASEQYAKDIPMSDPRSKKSSLIGKIFMFLRMWRDKARSRELNQSGQGDLVCFRFRKPA
jgi:SAM-dependent methyltransferase